MTVKVGLLCQDCRRRFGGEFTFRRHRPGGRCRTVAELRAIGLRRNPHGVWVRADPRNGQRRLFSARQAGLCRRLFGKSFRELSPEELRTYRAVLRALRGDGRIALRHRALADVQAGADPSPSDGDGAAPRRSQGGAV